MAPHGRLSLSGFPLDWPRTAAIFHEAGFYALRADTGLQAAFDDAGAGVTKTRLSLMIGHV